MKAGFVKVLYILCLRISLVRSISCIVGPDHDFDLQFQVEGIAAQCREEFDFCLRVDARLVDINDINATGK